MPWIFTQTVRIEAPKESTGWYWVAADRPISENFAFNDPTLLEFFHGPFATEQAAQADADRALQEYLGPDCKITPGAGWPFKTKQ